MMISDDNNESHTGREQRNLINEGERIQLLCSSNYKKHRYEIEKTLDKTSMDE